MSIEECRILESSTSAMRYCDKPNPLALACGKFAGIGRMLRFQADSDDVVPKSASRTSFENGSDAKGTVGAISPKTVSG
jgi:hypothetical protein